MLKFAAIDEERYSSLKNAKVVIVQVPYDATVTYGKGAKFGPEAIIKASNYMEQFDDELNKQTYKIGIHTKRPLRVQRLSAKKMTKHVQKVVEGIVGEEKFPVILGGEHSVSIGSIRAIAKNVKHLSILQLDAHCDLRNEYKGSRYNHACFGRRVLELAPIVQVGVRSLSEEENAFLPHPKVRIINAYDIQKDKDWMRKACEALSENVYVTIDLDVFDPSIVSSTGTPEPGGIGWYDMIGLLNMLTKKRRVVGFDVVELCPTKGQQAPDFLAAKLVYKFLGYIFNKKK